MANAMFGNGMVASAAGRTFSSLFDFAEVDRGLEAGVGGLLGYGRSVDGLWLRCAAVAGIVVGDCGALTTWGCASTATGGGTGARRGPE